MKHFKFKRKLNNKGLSLIEILVTVAIVALVAAPLINSFLGAMKTNSKARIIQNGTAVAQDTAELFKVFDVQALVDTYTDVDGVTVTYDSATGAYAFEGLTATGADGESFVVDVELDPTQYEATGNVAEDANRVIVNDVNLPVFSSLHRSDAIVLYRQYAGSDDQLADLFEGKLSPSILTTIDSPEVRKKITKSTVVNIDCTYDSTMEKFLYEVSLELTYTYNDSVSVQAIKTLEKTYGENEIHNIYLLCPIFDRYTTSNPSGDGSYYYNTDKIYVNYTYNGLPDKQHKIYVYIAEQNMSVLASGYTGQMRINPGNIILTTNSFTGSYMNYENENNYLKVYTNIGDADEYFENKYSLTYGDYNTGTSLYNMNVTVKQEGSDDVIAKFNTSK